MFVSQDHYDVKMPCHLLAGKLAGAAPDQVRQALPRLVDPLQRTLHAKVKQDAVKQEVLVFRRDGDSICMRGCRANWRMLHEAARGRLVGDSLLYCQLNKGARGSRHDSLMRDVHTYGVANGFALVGFCGLVRSRKPTALPR